MMADNSTSAVPAVNEDVENTDGAAIMAVKVEDQMDSSYDKNLTGENPAVSETANDVVVALATKSEAVEPMNTNSDKVLMAEATGAKPKRFFGMNSIQLQPYGDYKVTGQKVGPFYKSHELQFLSRQDGEFFNIEKKSFGAIMVKNPNNSTIYVSVSTKNPNADENRIIAAIRYDPFNDVISINDTWYVDEHIAEGHEFDENNMKRKMQASTLLNIELRSSNFEKIGNNRLDIRLRNGNFATIFMTESHVLRVRFNGNYFFPRMVSFASNVTDELFEKWESQ